MVSLSFLEVQEAKIKVLKVIVQYETYTNQANKKPTLHTHLDKVFFVSPMLSHDLIDKKNKLGFTLISTPPTLVF